MTSNFAPERITEELPLVLVSVVTLDAVPFPIAAVNAAVSDINSTYPLMLWKVLASTEIGCVELGAACTTILPCTCVYGFWIFSVSPLADGYVIPVG
ncbi:hypothetical protein [Martelella radicis]|uniref:Uncharacterized protein n=1 Tax=Martelella radicis TaxID=1397476 RepID=A0A7W6KNV8_9HYPH|nr:hypothetical protein [Martelella radicis]MBB4123248.1 hypothetical protein [Martelella radicis]